MQNRIEMGTNTCVMLIDLTKAYYNIRNNTISLDLKKMRAPDKHAQRVKKLH